MYITVKARCVFGALKCICSRITISEESLNWFLDNGNLLVGICNCFKFFCQRVGYLDTDISEFLNSTDISSEVEGFLNFCLKLRKAIKKWKEKVAIKDVTTSDIQNLRNLYPKFSYICSETYIPEFCIKELEVQQLADSCEDIKNRLQENFIHFIPGMRW